MAIEDSIFLCTIDSELSVASQSPFVAVDIGNSGLRAVSLSLHEQPDAALKGALRIYWDLNRFDRSTERVDQDVKNEEDRAADLAGTRRRYHPDSKDWLTLLDSLCEQADQEWFISSVRSDACQMLVEHLENRRCRIHIVDFNDMPFKIDVTEPGRVGVDRLLAALAATTLAATTQAAPKLSAPTLRSQSDHTSSMADNNVDRADNGPEHLIVIQAGSAVTVDVVSKFSQGDHFMGGAILPGVPMMLKLLGRMADQLPELDANDLTELPPLPGRNTEQAMVLGAASALVGGVQHLVERYRRELSVKMSAYQTDSPNSEAASIPVILSGGDGTRLATHLVPPLIVETDLVLRGLWELAKRRMRASSTS